MATRKRVPKSARVCGAMLLAGCLCWSAFAAQGPRLRCRTTIYDFGTLADTNQAEHAFLVRNEGDADLTITKVRACCGASAKMAALTIPAGSNTEFNIRMSLRGRSGKLHKSFYLHNTDSSNSVQQFTLAGTVVATGTAVGGRPGSGPSNSAPAQPEVLVVEPRAVLFGGLTTETETQRTVTVSSGTGKKVQVLQATCSQTNLQITLKEVEPRKKYEVLVSTRPPLEPGEFRGDIQLLVKDYRIHRIGVPVHGTVTANGQPGRRP